MLQTIASKHLDWNVPTVCPVCGHPLEINENLTRLVCTNINCRQKLIARINCWAATHKIKEWAPTTISTLIDAGLISSLPDCYSLDYNKVVELDRFGEKSASTLKRNMLSVNKTSIDKFITGYDIMDIGASQSKKMLKHAKVTNLEELESKLSNVNNFVCSGIGEKTAEKFVSGCKELIEDMKQLNKFVSIEEEKEEVAKSNKLGKKSFCFTGAASRPRKELQALVKENDGIVADGVKKGLDYLVIADPNSTSSKAVKARQLGITLISEDEFINMLK